MRKNKFNCSLKKQIIAQSILWAIAMLSVAIFDKKEFVVLILILLSYMSVYIFRNHHTGKELSEAVEEYEKKYPDPGKVPRPPHWSGWRLLPDEIEFWLDGDGRIHERLNYKNNNGKWEKELLYP